MCVSSSSLPAAILFNSLTGQIVANPSPFHAPHADTSMGHMVGTTQSSSPPTSRDPGGTDFYPSSALAVPKRRRAVKPSPSWAHTTTREATIQAHFLSPQICKLQKHDALLSWCGMGVVQQHCVSFMRAIHEKLTVSWPVVISQ